MSDMPSNAILAWLIEKLVAVGNGLLNPVLVGPTWDEVHAGNVRYTLDGWEIEVFNDGDSWDYIDFAISPHGDHYEVNFNERPDPVQVIAWVDPVLAKQVERRFITVGKSRSSEKTGTAQDDDGN